MSLIRLFTPDGAHGDGFELGDGEALVVGRAPDVESSRVKAVLGERTGVERLPVASPSVSANHVLLESVADRVIVTDLASRNGTWVRVPDQSRIEVDGATEVQVRVGEAPIGARAEDDEPPDVQWSDSADFASAIAEMAHAWLARTSDAAEVQVIDDTGAALPPGTVRIPLPGAQALDVRIHRTVDADWPRRLGRLWNHIGAQVKLFDAEVSARADGMILASDGIRLVYRQVVDAGIRGERLMLLGPSGSGKELLARAYHRHSNRSGPFVAINCAELDDRIRAELFGTEIGAFTDAVKRAGAIEAANGGTLFLDEIGELSREVQATLLRFLDRGEFARMGDLARTRKADALIVCATNRDLREAVRQDRFRLDLWFRLASHVVEVPPLHLRLDDLEAYLRARRQRGAASTWEALSPEAIEIVRSHRWDGRWGGNFRELENFAARLPTASGPGSLDASTCRRAIEAGSIGPSAEPVARIEQGPVRSAATWTQVAAAAAHLAATSYAEDHGSAPADWNAVKDYIENHLKPVLFARLAGVGDATNLETAKGEATRLGADRATRLKQLERYFERFAPPPGVRDSS